MTETKAYILSCMIKITKSIQEYYKPIYFKVNTSVTSYARNVIILGPQYMKLLSNWLASFCEG